MSTFSIDEFAARCKANMNDSEDRQAAASAALLAEVERCGPQAILDALAAAVPPGADVGEMIVHASSELTLLYARIPARFQAAVHNHTVFACIAQLSGLEENTVYEREDRGLREVRRMTGTVGTVVNLPADAIHSIENPGEEAASALHLYGGDLAGLADERSLWDAHDHAEQGFSFPALVRESAKAMKRSNNQLGLDALVEAIPTTAPLVASL